MAGFLNTFFASFDYNILSFFHSLADTFDFILRPISEIINVIGGGETSLITFVGFIIFLTTKDDNKKKKAAAMFGATALVLIFINLLIKNIVNRPRPFDTVETFRQWWEYVGSMYVSDSSFPSGHTVGATTGIVAYLITGKNKNKWSYLLLLYPFIVGCSRLYMQVHYPSDVLFGFIFGILIALLAKFICYILWKYFYKFMPFFDKLIMVILIGYSCVAGYTLINLFI